MSPRVRAIGIVVGTLLIGVVIGALIVGPLAARHHFRRIADLRTPRGFAERMEEIIEPDESQVDTLRVVLSEYGERFDEVVSRHRGEMKAVFDSLHSELDPILTDEQKERLEERRRRIGSRGGPQGRHAPEPPE